MAINNRKRSLVLSGGGGRGAYHVGVLRFLEEHEWIPGVVTGTSIGAVNGAAMASGHNSRSLWALWQGLHTKDVQKVNLNPLHGNYLLDTAPLRATLEREGWVDFERINSPEAAIHLRVTGTEMNTGKLRVFGNSDDLHPSQMIRETLTLDHIIASCSIPIVYPATLLNESLYWDGATVANTPLGPAIDAGAEEFVVVIMTPWDDDEADAASRIQRPTAVLTPHNLLTAASTMMEWALLASFQADLKMFRRVKELVSLQLENARLRAANAVLQKQLSGEHVAMTDKDNDGIPDNLKNHKYHKLSHPIVVAPLKPISVEQILSYTLEGHQELYELGYNDAKRAWQAAGRIVNE